MNKLWIIGIGIVAILIIGFVLLSGNGDSKITTSTTTTNSNQTNGLLGAIAGIWGGIKGSGGDSDSGYDQGDDFIGPVQG